MAKEVLIVIVNYQSSETLLGLLRSIPTSYSERADILIADNSFELTCLPQDIKDRFLPKILLLPDNNGFASGVNMGLRMAEVGGYKYVWLLNPDTTIDPSALPELIQFQEQLGTPAILGSLVLMKSHDDPEDRSLTIWSRGGFINFENESVSMNSFGETLSAGSDDPINCDYVPGCSLFFPTSLVTDLGYFDESYFLYFEETDWCLRASEKGIPRYVVPKSIIWHESSPEKMQAPFRVYYYNRNRLRFFSKFGSTKDKFLRKARVLTSMIPEVTRALINSEDEDTRSELLAQRSAYMDFIFERSGRKEGV